MLQGVGSKGVKECAERVQILKRAVKAAAMYGPPATHVSATLALCNALRLQRSMLAEPEADPRPHLQQLLQLLYDAETRLLVVLPLCAPPDAPPATTHPLHAVYARLLAHLAAAHAEHACADLWFAKSDLRARRPAFQTFPRPAHRALAKPPGEHGSLAVDSRRAAVPREVGVSEGEGATLPGAVRDVAFTPEEASGAGPPHSPENSHPPEHQPHGSSSAAKQPPGSSAGSSRAGHSAGSEAPAADEPARVADTTGAGVLGQPDGPRSKTWEAGSTPQAAEAAPEPLAEDSAAAVERFLDATEDAARAERGEDTVADASHAFQAARHACVALAVCGRGAVAVDAQLAHARARMADLQLQELLLKWRAGGCDAPDATATAGSSSAVPVVRQETAGEVESVDPGAAVAAICEGTAADDGDDDEVGPTSEQNDGMVRTGRVRNCALVRALRAEVLPLLNAAMGAAVRLRDWPRADLVGQALVRVLRVMDQLTGAPSGTLAPAEEESKADSSAQGQAAGADAEGGGVAEAGEDGMVAGEDTVGVKRARELAEAVVVWRTCDALAQDSAMLQAWAPLRHTARVAQRVGEWWQRPEDAERHSWCADLERAALPHVPAVAPAVGSGVDPADAAEAGSGEDGSGEETALMQHQQALRASGWVNGRSAGMLCGPLQDCVASLPAGVAAVVLAVEVSACPGQSVPQSAFMHAVSVRQVPRPVGAEGVSDTVEWEAVDLVHCVNTVDLDGLEALLARVDAWGTALEAADHRTLFGAQAVQESGSTEETVMGPPDDVDQGESSDAHADTGGSNGDKPEAGGRRALAAEWNMILEQMEALMEPMQPALTAAAAEMAVAAPPMPAKPAKGQKGGTPVEPPPPGRPAVVLCACPRLAGLPLEALAALADTPALARDRSVHHAAARWQLTAKPDPVSTAAEATVNVAKAACSVSSELQEVVGLELAAVERGEWKVNAYRPDRGVSQAYHLMMSKESKGLMHWTCEPFGTHVHGETLAGMELREAGCVVVMDRLAAPIAECEERPEAAGGGGLDGEAAGTKEPATVAIRPQRQQRPPGTAAGDSGLPGVEPRMCMLLQRGAACCVGNRWPLTAEAALRVVAAVLPPAGTVGVAAATRAAARAASEEQRVPWLPACTVVYGTPGLVLQSSGAVDEGQGTKKKK